MMLYNQLLRQSVGFAKSQEIHKILSASSFAPVPVFNPYTPIAWRIKCKKIRTEI